METNPRKREAPPPIPLEKNRLEALVKAWIEDGEVVLRPIERQPTLEEQRSPKFCLFHRNTIILLWTVLCSERYIMKRFRKEK